MAYKIIPITQRPDGSLSVDLKNIKIRQGDYDLYQLSYSSNTDYSSQDDVEIQVSFRRRDGQQTGWLPLTHVSEKKYYLNLKSRWFTNEGGNLYLTFRVIKSSSDLVDLILHTSSISLPIEKDYAFNVIEDIMPSGFEQYKLEVQDKFNEVDNELSDLKNNVESINVPTKTSDLTNDGDDGSSPYATKKDVDDAIEDKSNVEEVGNKLYANVNSTNYVLTLKLLNKYGQTLDEQQVDLPLEEMVVNADYNEETKSITLTLKNGETISFSVADLVEGLASQNELDATNANVTNLTTRVETAESSITTLNINKLEYKGETTEDNVSNLLNVVGDMCYVTGTRKYQLCVESTYQNGHINKKFMPIVAEVDLSNFVSSETFNDLVNNRINISNNSSGGAIGYGASAGSGFAGGQNAKTTEELESGATRVVDAIQLGTGTNLQDRTLQVYNDNIYDANTHTGKFQNISLNGNDLQGELDDKQDKLTIDSSLNIASSNPIMNSAVTSALNKKLDASKYVVDTSLNSTSNNPIANSVVTAINAAVENKPNKWQVAYDIDAFIDQSNLLWLSLNNNLGEQISRVIVDLTEYGLTTKDYVDSKLSGTDNDIAIASSNTKYTISTSSTEISLLNEFLNKTSNSTVRMRGCAYGNGIYVIVGTSGAVQYSTDNAETWNIIPAFTTNVIVSVAYGGGIFICVDSAGGIFKSRDCINWEQLSSPITDIINAIVYVNGKFALVGANGLIAFSNDATNFNVVASGVTNELTSITRGLDKYVAVSTSGDILTSINGIDWTNNSVDTTHYRTSTFGKNIFVIGGQGGKIKYSTDAINWIDATNDSTSSVNYIRDIKYANGKFYAVMYISTGQGEIWTSLDGATWTKTQTTAARLWCLGYGNDIFFASGDNGAIWVLNQNINWVDTQPTINGEQYLWSKDIYYLTDGSILEGEVEVYPELTNLEKKIPTIVTLTQAQYDELVANGTITIDGVEIVFNENTLYLIKEE